jgi:hypothetical protein
MKTDMHAYQYPLTTSLDIDDKNKEKEDKNDDELYGVSLLNRIFDSISDGILRDFEDDNDKNSDYLFGGNRKGRKKKYINSSGRTSIYSSYSSQSNFSSENSTFLKFFDFDDFVPYILGKESIKVGKGKKFLEKERNKLKTDFSHDNKPSEILNSEKTPELSSVKANKENEKSSSEFQIYVQNLNKENLTDYSISKSPLHFYLPSSSLSTLSNILSSKPTSHNLSPFPSFSQNELSLNPNLSVKNSVSYQDPSPKLNIIQYIPSTSQYNVFGVNGLTATSAIVASQNSMNGICYKSYLSKLSLCEFPDGLIPERRKQLLLVSEMKRAMNEVYSISLLFVFIIYLG